MSTVADATDKVKPRENEYALDKDNPLATARRFLKANFAHPYGCRLVYSQQTWYAWNFRAFAEREPAWVRAKLYRWLEHCTCADRDKVRPFQPNQQDVTRVADALMGLTYTEQRPPAWLDRPPEYPSAAELLVGPTGMINLSDPDAGLYPCTPALFTTNAIDYPIDLATPPPRAWLDFLESVWPGDAESIALLQEWFGYCLSPEKRADKMLLIVGPKRSGKGTILRVLARLVGEANVCAPTLSGLATQFGLAPMVGKPVGIIDDARLSGRSDLAVIIERLLTVSAGGRIDVDRKMREALVGVILPTRLTICTNELPDLRDAAGAAASRFLVLAMTRSFYGQEDTTLADRLYAEMPGILRWALQGWQRLSGRGFRFVQPATGRQTLDELSTLASPIRSFIDDWCLVGPEHSVPRDELYAAWRLWTADEGMRTTDRPRFGRDLRAAVTPLFTVDRQQGELRWREYQGIGFKPEAAADLARRNAPSLFHQEAGHAG
jgi:putative DNA primase/helicase